MPEPTPQQMEELQEKIKNMSPEELREFQKQQCIFCHIIGGKVQSKTVYDDEHVKAILDINPSNPGHILLLPKEHYAIMPQMPEEIIAHMGKIAKQLSAALIKALKVEGTTIFIANGVAAGQRAQHFMMHVIPRKEKDGVPLDLPQKKISKQELDKIRQAIQPAINKVFGIVPGQKEETEQEEEKEEGKKGPEKKHEPKKEEKDLDLVSQALGIGEPAVQEAEFIEEKEESKEQPAVKPKAKQKKKKTANPKEKTKKKKEKRKDTKEEATLDDIANLITG